VAENSARTSTCAPPYSLSARGSFWLGIAGSACFAIVAIWLVARGSFMHEGIRGFTLFDDAMISMRYGYNFATTGIIEWSKSSGRVEGLTNLGWMLVMSLLIRLTDIYTAPLAVSVVSALLLVAGIVVLGTPQSKFASVPPGLRIVALAGSFSLIVWGVRGFETSLVFTLISSIYVLTTSAQIGTPRRLIVIGLVFLGVITRDDFAIFAILYAILLSLFKFFARRWIWSPWSVPFILAISALVSFAIKVAFRVAYFADVYPNTYYLKVYGHDKFVIFARGLLGLFGNSLGVFAPIILALLLFFFWSRSACLRTILVQKELDSHLIVFSLLIYSALIGGDAWEWSRLANRFTCVALPFILLNFINYVDRFSRSDSIRIALTRKELADILPVYILLLPAFLGFGYAYQAITSKLSSKVTALSGFSPRNALTDWFLVGLCLLVLPYIWRSAVKFRETELRQGSGLLVVCVAVLILSQPLILLAKAEFKDNGNFLHVVDDSRQGLASLSSKYIIPSGSKVVSVWAGTFPYYRPDIDFIDPLGKMDSRIAKSKPRCAFYPGHTKWDWDYTLSRYEPDYVRGDLSEFRQDGMRTDKTPEWDNYYQFQEGLIRRKRG
jgi:hypothetical protein